MSFVHLHLHTEYSLIDSVIRIQSERNEKGERTVLGLMDAVAAAGMPAVALTDQSNLFAMVKFFRAAQAVGIKPIIGVDVWLQALAEQGTPTRLVLLCQNELGYRNLARLVSRSYLEGQHKGLAMLAHDWFDAASTGGLLALAGPSSDVGTALIAGRESEAVRLLETWRQLFDDRFYFALQRTGRAHEALHVSAAVTLASRFGIPVVASNDVRFIATTEFEAHEARVCIHEGTQLADPNRPRHYSEQQYLRSPAEMQQLFADLPEAIQNSVEIARRCSLELKLGKSVLPAYPVPNSMTIEEFFYAEAQQGLTQRWQQLTAHTTTTSIPQRQYQQRLDIELAVICQMGFAGYFLIVADFIRWAKANDIPVGPGRGSGAGSLVAYALGITDLDPLQYDLLFERFLNPERVSMPDFDVDFCMLGRDRVIEYVAEKYGRERVSQIITYGSMAAKAVVRDVARVMGHSYGFADSIAKLIPFELGITLQGALAKEADLKRRYEEEDDTRAVLDLAMSLEGLVRNAGMHAGGVVIAPSVLTDFAPLFCDAAGKSLVTQFDKDDIEAAGLVKFDFLGLRTLTIIHWAVQNINKGRAAVGEAPLDMLGLPLSDARTFTLMQRGDTTAVFQLESRGMKDLIRRLQPDCFEDIIALVALFRPGPLQSGMVDDFIARKKADRNTPIDYLHPDLKPVLAPTYGVILYQEQVMQIAQVLAGYTLGSADLLRRAMGKKNADEMAKQRSIFVQGAVARGVDETKAIHIFDLMEKFAGYGFNKSHSAAYALLSYQTAWLKTHYPAAFMAAVLSSDMDKTEKVVSLIDEVRRMQLHLEPPDVNASAYRFTVSGPQTIRYGLGAIKGIGEGVVAALVNERQQHGVYKSLADFCQRMDTNRCNRRALEALIRAGAMDGFANRATLMHGLSQAMQLADQSVRARAVGQADLFGLQTATTEVSVEIVPEWDAAERLTGERETLGLYLTGHPFDAYRDELKPVCSGTIADLTADKPVVQEGFRFQGKPVTVAAMIDDVFKRGNRVILKLDDCSARLEATLFEEAYQQYREVLKKNAIVLLEGHIRYDDFIDGWRLTVKAVQDIAQVRQQYARRLLLRWPKENLSEDSMNTLAAILRAHRPGHCVVQVDYGNHNATAALTLSEEWKVNPDTELLSRLQQLFGADNVRLHYAPKLHA